jgi:hypothetical protein
MYCWTHIKTVEIPVACVNLLLPNENIYTFLFNPKDSTCTHGITFLNYIPLCTAVDQYKSCSFHCAHSCTVLPINTTLFTFLHSPTNPHYIVHIPAQSYQSTLQFPISLSQSTVLWNILSLRAIQGFRHDAADVRVTLGYDVANVVGVFLRFGINIRFYSQAYNITTRQNHGWLNGWMDE